MDPEYCEIERKAYAEGFRAAREKAAGIAEEFLQHNAPMDFEDVKSALDHAAWWVADRIRKMEVTP
jgi:hypothetical protein